MTSPASSSGRFCASEPLMRTTDGGTDGLHDDDVCHGDSS